MLIEELPLLTPADELALAKACPDGMWLSPAAQVLHEEEGRARFLRHHGRALRAALDDLTPPLRVNGG